MNLRELHDQAEPLLLCNVWDAASARIAAQSGFTAIGTSSAAIATNMGVPDGEHIPFRALLDTVKRIKTATSLPLNVDLENGYAQDPHTITAHIKTLAAIDVAGINIEDSRVLNNNQTLLDADNFAAILSTICQNLKAEGINTFINIRTDPYLLNLPNARSETLKRIAHYQQTSVDGIFVPCLTTKEDIRTITASTTLPVNVMCMPDLPDFATLQQLGIKRISMGNWLHEYMHNRLQYALNTIRQQHTFADLFAHA